MEDFMFDDSVIKAVQTLTLGKKHIPCFSFFSLK